ncbi:hypothetical protein N7490_007218 [Penicillium lividum]|nr:hypothetical protein N7490_007218 [Penicillium lividum]
MGYRTHITTTTKPNPEKFTAIHALTATISHNCRDHVLGIVGFGSISKKLAFEACMTLGMKIHYFHIVRATQEEEKELEATSYNSFDDLPNVADCVMLLTLLNKHTQDLIDDKAVSLMKPGIRLVNTARGEIISEDALIQALESGHLSAAALDVHYYEPQVSPQLAGMDNITLNTHIGDAELDTRINFELNGMKYIPQVVGPKGEFVGGPITPVNRTAFEAAA